MNKSGTKKNTSILQKVQPLTPVEFKHNPLYLKLQVEKDINSAVAFVSSVLSQGKGDWIQTANRMIRATINGKATAQLFEEIEKMIDNGLTSKEKLNSRIGSATLSDLLEMFENKSSDPEVLSSAKAIFLKIINVNSSEQQQIYFHQLYKRVKELNSMQLLVLKACWDLTRDGQGNYSNGTETEHWINAIVTELGEVNRIWITLEHNTLVDLQLLEGYLNSERSRITGTGSARLSQLGRMLCEAIFQYRIT